MPASGKVLEDSIRLSRIRRIKLALYLVQAAMLVAFGVLLIVVLGGAQLEPYLYIPLDAFLTVLVLLLLIICIESFFFRMLEIRFARSSSARHLMAKNSIKRSIVFAIIAGTFFVVLTFPSMLNAIADSTEQTIDVNPALPAPHFYSTDTYALIETVDLFVTAPRIVHIYVVDDDIYEDYDKDDPDYMNAMYTYRMNRDDFIVDESLTIPIPQSEFTRYYLVVNDIYNPGTQATVLVEKQVSETFTGVMWLLLLAFLVANIAWVAYLIPIERKYSSGSIYK